MVCDNGDHPPFFSLLSKFGKIHRRRYGKRLSEPRVRRSFSFEFGEIFSIFHDSAVRPIKSWVLAVWSVDLSPSLKSFLLVFHGSVEPGGLIVRKKEDESRI